MEREASSPQEFREVRSLARRFVVSESTVRDPLNDLDAVRAARQRPMSERLEQALSWNLVASELRAGFLELENRRDLADIRLLESLDENE